MKTFVTLLALSAFTSVNAQELPPVPEGGLFTTQHGICIDNPTGREGYCVFLVDLAGNVYLTFLMEDQVMFIRQITADGYDEIYTHGKFPL